MVEQGTENPRVGGSIPSLGTSKIKGLAVMPLTPFLLGCAWVADGCGVYRYNKEVAMSINDLNIRRTEDWKKEQTEVS